MKPNETIKSYYSVSICAKCNKYNNGMCLKYNSKPYIARYECEKLHKILDENKQTRLEQIFESKYSRICKLKNLLDCGVSTEFILNELSINPNRLKNDKKFIKQLLIIRNYLDKGFSDFNISKEVGCTLDKISIYKIYIHRNPDLFK